MTPSLRNEPLLRLGALLTAFACALPGSARRTNAPAHEAGTPDTGCVADFEFLVSQVERNYAGYSDKASGRHGALRALTDSVAAAARVAEDAPACTRLLQTWVAFFQDRHVSVYPVPQPAPGGRPPEPSAEPTQPSALRPSFTSLDDSTLLLRIPSFDLQFKPPLDSLLATNYRRLTSTPLVMIDIRGNTGGGDATFSELIPFIYTNPIREMGTDVLASDDNIAFFRSLLERRDLPPSVIATVGDLVRRAEMSHGRFLSFEVQVITKDTVYADPKMVAILIDSSVASAAEQFLLQAKQSRKVVLFGTTNSAGVDDYANVRPVELPSRLRRAGIPTSRSRRLPNAPVDPYGIAPDVRVPYTVSDLLSYVRCYYRAGPHDPHGSDGHELHQ